MNSSGWIFVILLISSSILFVTAVVAIRRYKTLPQVDFVDIENIKNSAILNSSLETLTGIFEWRTQVGINPSDYDMGYDIGMDMGIADYNSHIVIFCEAAELTSETWGALNDLISSDDPINDVLDRWWDQSKAKQEG